MADLTHPDLTAVETEGLVLAGQAEDLVVRDPATFQAAGQFLVSLKAYQARVHEIFAPIIKAAHDAHKVALAQRDSLLGGAQAAERILKGAMVAYEQQQRAEDERRRQEQDRIAREQAEAMRQATATALDQAGQPQAAEAVRRAPSAPVVLPPAPAPPTVAGVRFSDHWTAEVTDFAALVQAVASGAQPLHLLLPNEPALHALARTLKDTFAVPGVRVTKARRAAAGGR